MRIRLMSLPTTSDFDEFDLRPYRAGQIYDVPARLASLLILTGHAEPVSVVEWPRDQAADSPRKRSVSEA